ncbi:hypothetical protein HFO38_04870 [Rhizobium leguminosarum]|uniref:hypothetical protein n=1 Tax=Rhizobium leguminosarum TaxID=384 RepID=UPI001C986C0B|nr:hypothetical protein [Rhizobium leguminosarum]MBY5702070.1 hypothetical protein [Rhizobium leguminosarum]
MAEPAGATARPHRRLDGRAEVSGFSLQTVICGDLHSHACVDVSVIVHRIIDLCFV